MKVRRAGSIAKDFKMFASIIMLVVFLISSVISIIIYNSQKEKTKSRHIDQAVYIDHFLTETFEYITQYTRFLGEKIITSYDADPKFIAELFSSKSQENIETENSYSWTLFDWIDPNKYMLVNTKHGVLPHYINMSTRSYLLETPNKPWQLIFSNPAKGMPSNQMVIPTGVGIADSKGKFYGTIGIGFSIDALTNKINMLTNQTGVKFILLNSELVYITSSIDVNKEEISGLINDLKKIIKPDLKSVNFETVSLIGNIEFSYLKKVDKHPFYIIIGEDKRASKSRFISNILPRIVELIFLGMVCIILLYYSRKLLVNPIIQLSQVAEKIANNEDQVIIPLIEYEEAQILAFQLKDIQAMKKELVEAKLNVEQTNASLEQNVKERTVELENALAAKTEFLNNMSHEIRTPIQGFVNISAGLDEHWNELADEKKQELASKVASNAKRLSRLVGHLLDLSKFSAGKMLLDIRPFELNEAVENIIEECKSLYLNGKKLQFKFKKSPKVIVQADQERIAQVLRNLFVNAIKFSQENSLISAEIQKSEAILKFTIKDQGVGIPASEINDIFSAFTISSRTKSKAGGTGLGLAIAREIIAAHQGRIWAENNPEGGAIFSFEIPVKQTQENEITTLKQSSKRKATIMIVDDEEASLTGMEMLLFGGNYNLVKTNGGTQALDYLRKHDPASIDLILLDLMMPDMYGLNVLEQIKKDPKFSHIKVVLQTGSADEKEINKAYKLGAVSHISKPYEKHRILDLLKKIL